MSRVYEAAETVRFAEGEREPATPAREGDSPTATRVRPDRWPYRVAVAVLLVGLLVSGALVWVSRTQYINNERRLLDLRARDVGSVLAVGLPNLQTPLASAAALADATNGDLRKFRAFVAPYVGPQPDHRFVSISLWRLSATERGPVAVVGVAPILGASASASATRAFFSHVAGTAKLTVIGLWPPRLSRLGYAFATSEPTSRFAAYGESILPANRRSRLEGNSAFSDLDYAIYLGKSENAPDLLVTSLAHPRIRGRQAKLTVPFGDTYLTLVVAPRQALAGTLPQRLPWIIAIVGTLLAIGAAGLTFRLIQRRGAAEQLAGRLELAVDENQQLYDEQRTIAQTLQHALLPEEMPRIRGGEASAQYAPGERGVDIGGDWYDVIPLDDRRLLVVVGDVSGRGLRAAATMASLRYAIHAYAAQDDPPATILAKLSNILSVADSGQIATVLCALIDVDSRLVAVASAGHLPPLLISDHSSEYIECEVGVPIGVQNDAPYAVKTVAAPPAATLVAFTDGLVERRNESLDSGLRRLQEAAAGEHAGLPELLTRIVTQLRRAPSEDDMAIVGFRWTD